MARIPLLGDGRADDESGRPDGWQLGITLSYFFVEGHFGRFTQAIHCRTLAGKYFALQQNDL
jgi:hypothetical protein